MSGSDGIKGYLAPAVADRLDQLILDHKVESVIEIGSFVGKSAVFFAERVDTVICIDPFELEKGGTGGMTDKRWVYAEAGWNTHYEMFLANTLPYLNIRHMKLPSSEAAHFPIEADLIYIDGDHSYEGVVADIQAYRPKARKVLCGDDNLNPRFRVTEAIVDMGIENRSERCWWQIVS